MTMLVPKIQTLAGQPYQSLNTFFQSIGPSAYYFSVDNSVGGQFVSPQGFIYEIPAFAFVDSWNQPVSGEVQLRVLEISNKRSLFYAGYSSLSNCSLLDMKYCLELEIVQEPRSGIRLGRFIRLVLPSGKNGRWSDCMVYQKQTAKVHLLQGDIRNIWAPSAIPLLLQKNGMGKEPGFYTAYTGAFMIGKEINKSKKAKKRAMISVVPDQGGPSLSHIQAYLVFHESDTIVQLEEQRGSFSAFHLPKGKKASLLLIGLEKGTFYFYRSFLGSLSNQRIECCLQPINHHQLQAELQRMIF